MSKKTKQEAIEYIYSEKHGVYENLIKEFGKDIVDSLCVTGLIKRGQETSSVNSWQITTEGSNFIGTILPRKKFSIMERMQNTINDLFIDKNLKITTL
ncbi:hypothetical protein [Aliarcobacter butzleri]|uniref:hypothetical protein n=1 Tax=Aliarcobacter butzleri TaxID=28197 RepID=UPI003AF76FBB